MKAVAVTPGLKDSVRMIETEKPIIHKKSILVRVLKVGIDGTDIEINQGFYGEAPEGRKDLILGHEAIGRVDEVGGEVEGFKKGDLVVSTVRRPCPEDCPNCHDGESDLCRTGDFKERGIKALDGFMSQFYGETPEYLVRVPDDLEEIGVLLEPFSIVEKGIYHIFKIQERMFWKPKRVLVLGAGSLGLLAGLIFREKGLTVYLSARKGLTGARAEAVNRTGMVYLQNLPFDQIRMEYGEMDIIFEATGFSPFVFDSPLLLGPNGITCLAGIPANPSLKMIDTTQLHRRMVLKNQVLFGTVNANRKYFEMGLKEMQAIEHSYPGLLKRLITQRLALPDFKKAFDPHLDHIKTVIDMGQGTT